MQTAYAFNLEGFRRTSERKEYQTEVSFSVGSRCFNAFLINVSAGGALLSNKGMPTMRPGNEIAITIPFAVREGCVKKKAIVMWVEDGQFGIQFI